MNEIGLSRKRGVVSAVHISSAIASYARMSINEFKNMPGNPCIMSDTDSVVLIIINLLIWPPILILYSKIRKFLYCVHIIIN